jgi:5-methylcytosine-specific restriction endonuclease McrA
MICDVCQRDMRAITRGMCGACYRDWRKENAPPNARCECCSRLYFNTSRKRHSLCSRACFRAWKPMRNQHNEFTDGGKQVMHMCEWCRRPFGVEMRFVARGGGRFCSSECFGMSRRADPSTTTSPENAWRQRQRYNRFRNSILHAPGATCARCGVLRTHNNVVVHHVLEPDGDVQLLFDPSNLELLCRRCHLREHRARGHLERR